jgi:hypothetical protein
MCNAQFVRMSSSVSGTTSTGMRSDSCKYRLFVLPFVQWCIGRCKSAASQKTLILNVLSPLPWRNTAPRGPDLPLNRGFTNSLSYTHIRQDSSGRVISPTQRPVPVNIKHSQKTGIHVPSGIKTRNPSKGGAADPRLKLRGHRHRPMIRIRRENE